MDDGQHGSHAHTTTGTDYGTEVLDVSGTPQGPHNVGDVVPFVQSAEFRGGSPHGLDDQVDGACLCIASGNGQGNAFAILAHTDNHKVAGPTSLGNQGGLHYQFIYFLAKLFFFYDFVHDDEPFMKISQSYHIPYKAAGPWGYGCPRGSGCSPEGLPRYGAGPVPTH